MEAFKNLIWLAPFIILGIETVPYRLSKLVGTFPNLPQEIYLIYDLHYLLTQPHKKPTQEQRELLTKQELKKFTETEREFIATLKQYGSQDPNLFFFHEFYHLKGFEPPNQVNLEKLFLVNFSTLLPQLFPRHNFADVDTYRKGLGQQFVLLKLFADGGLDKKYFSLSIEPFITSLKLLASNQFETILTDLNAIQNQQAKELAQQQWNTLQEKIAQFYQDYFSKKPLKTVTDLDTHLRQTAARKKFAEQYNNLFFENLANLNFFIKVVVSPATKMIVYGGGIHQRALIENLKVLGYVLAIDIGTTQGVRAYSSGEKFANFLTNNAWNYLYKEPHASLINLSDNLFKEWTDLSIRITRAPDISSSTDLYFAGEIEKLLANWRSSKSFMNITEIFNIENLQTLLFATIKKGFYECTKKLLEAGAKVNTFDVNGNAPLITALTLSDAQRFVALLVQYGASLKLPDGKTILQLLQEHPTKYPQYAQLHTYLSDIEQEKIVKKHVNVADYLKKFYEQLSILESQI